MNRQSLPSSAHHTLQQQCQRELEKSTGPRQTIGRRVRFCFALRWLQGKIQRTAPAQERVLINWHIADGHTWHSKRVFILPPHIKPHEIEQGRGQCHQDQGRARQSHVPVLRVPDTDDAQLGGHNCHSIFERGAMPWIKLWVPSQQRQEMVGNKTWSWC